MRRSRSMYSGLWLGQPLHERPTRVQGNGDFGILVEQFQKWPIAVAVGVVEDMAEIADGLMIVQRQNEAKRHGRILSIPRDRRP